jgi:hypothetical protein
MGESLPAPTRDHPVWAALSAYEVGSPDSALPFLDRLARENGWRPAHAARVWEEYRRFCFLAASAGHPVTPSDAVDQAWHLHLLYPRDYWERFCPEVLRRPLHHGPSTGGVAEERRYFAQYADTLSAYEAAFGQAPPADLWPIAVRRLRDDPRARRVHPRDYILLPRRPALAAIALTLAGAAAWVWGG